MFAAGRIEQSAKRVVKQVWVNYPISGSFLMVSRRASKI